MTGATSSVKRVLADFPIPILPKIDREPTKEGLIYLHQLVSGNVASALSNIVGGQHGHLAITMRYKEYRSQTVFAFVLPHNPSN